MPFAYYGAKHKLSARGVYPAPTHDTIIEPFAGSAAYAVVHAATIDRVVLIDRDPAVVALWRELQAIDTHGLDVIAEQLRGRWTRHPLIAASAGGHQLAQTLAGRPVTITPWMRKSWPSVRRRIEAALPHIRSWSIDVAPVRGRRRTGQRVASAHHRATCAHRGDVDMRQRTIRLIVDGLDVVPDVGDVLCARRTWYLVVDATQKRRLLHCLCDVYPTRDVVAGPDGAVAGVPVTDGTWWTLAN